MVPVRQVGKEVRPLPLQSTGSLWVTHAFGVWSTESLIFGDQAGVSSCRFPRTPLLKHHN